MKKLIGILLVIAIIIGAGTAFYCKYNGIAPISVSESNIDTENDHIVLTAHRGCHTSVPENSLPAFKKAIELGYYAAECDVIRTSDGKWVITHDDKVSKHFFGTGKISEKTYDEVRKLKYNFDKEFWNYQDESIPSLEEYLDLFIGKSTRPEIEIKCKGLENLEDIVSAIEERGLTEQAIIISFNYDELKRIHELNPDIELWYLLSEITDEGIKDALAINCKFLSVNYKNNGADEIKKAMDSGLQVAVWTVDSTETVKEYYDMGVRYFVSNKICY